MKYTTSFGLLGAGTAFGLDQISKWLVVANAPFLSPGVSILPGFDLVFHRNSGVSFGTLSGVPSLALVVLALLICLWVIVQMVKTQVRSEALAYGLILGGGLGNALDRFRVGAVTDFLDLYVGDIHWPAFNLADTAIFCGVTMLITWPWLQKSKDLKRERNG